MTSPRLPVVFLWALAFSTAAAKVKEKRIKADENTEVNIWALLVAGSREYYNYRHQADICHAYHVLHNHGIPDERIVVMMYDDIANNTLNPTPGEIVNHPKGKNVYLGTPKDYTGDLVTPKNFLSILQGKKVKGGSGKVIGSGPKDHIFVYFSDHGAPGILAFPETELHAKPFVRVIKKMHEENKFAKMVMYIEACYSGSMFDGLLPNNFNVYVTTAADHKESSYACYWDDKRNAFLGDVYSVNWMENSDAADLQQVTLKDQFETVRKETTKSHVMQYGDLTFTNLPLSKFQGLQKAKSIESPKVARNAVPSADVPIAILRNMLTKASTNAAHRSLSRKLQRALRDRNFVKDKVAEIARFVAKGDIENATSLLGPMQQLRNFDCYEKAVRHFNEICFRLSKNSYALEYLSALANMCESRYPVAQIISAMDMACSHPAVFGIS
ncbi:hypothetical protein V5799_027368 [Amblyomma americanum]|uniref:legumain n=1 Tax=Amblyomma americanum TaxID=6943 RepID=A0AAQ4DFX3_AMBAM